MRRLLEEAAVSCFLTPAEMFRQWLSSPDQKVDILQEAQHKLKHAEKQYQRGKYEESIKIASEAIRDVETTVPAVAATSL